MYKMYKCVFSLGKPGSNFFSRFKIEKISILTFTNLQLKYLKCQ